MGLLRPATPGFLVTLTATVLLAIVSFSVPYFKSIFFLKASLKSQGISGSITFGTLGYCIELSNGTTCSKPSVGYELDINGLVGNDLPIDIPQVAVKWLTYALVLHIVALILAAVSSVFGLLAHVREMSMTCFSTCISGFGATVALLAFIFDLAFFFIAKSRINSVEGGSAAIGMAIWMTLAAWVLLFFAGCFYGLGRCCISRRPRDRDRDAQKPQVEDGYAEQVRLDAVRQEAERKMRQQKQEIGLPAFQETQPLTKADPEEYIEDGDHVLPYRPQNVGAGAYGRNGASQYAAGYSQAAPGTRAVDDYYNAAASQNTYPPQPRRQTSAHTQGSSANSTSYAPSHYTASPPPMPSVPAVPSNPMAPTQYLAAGGAYGHNQYASAASQEYGHPQRSTTYHSATSHQQYPTDYSAYQTTQQPDAFNTYNNTAYMTGMGTEASRTAYSPHTANTGYAAQQTQAYAQPAYQTAQHAPERSYTLGGDGYAASPITPSHSPHPADQYAQYAMPSADITGQMPSPYTPLPTPGATRTETFAPQSPHAPGGSQQPEFDDPPPPVYDVATAQPPGQWDTKR